MKTVLKDGLLHAMSMNTTAHILTSEAVSLPSTSRTDAWSRDGTALVEDFTADSSSIPDVDDVLQELPRYLAMIREHATTNITEALARQERPTSRQLGITALDPLDEIDSLATRIALLKSISEEMCGGTGHGRPPAQVAIFTTWSGDLWGLRRELLPWMMYHTQLGVCKFYVLYDGTDAKVSELLLTISHLDALFIHPPYASSQDQTSFKLWYEAHHQWKGQPGNYLLMVKQGYGTREAIHRAQQSHVEWLIHIDADELLHPGNPSFNIAVELASQPPHVSALRFMNFEGQVEAGDLVNRYEQVTLFRAHKHFVTPQVLEYRYVFKLGNNTAWLNLYSNGKSAVRVVPGIRQTGPHFFSGPKSERWATPSNPEGHWQNHLSETSVVLHYGYSYMSDVASKSNRSCPQEYYEAALKGDKTKVKECFVIDLDRDAFMAAASGSQQLVEDFFYGRCVMSEGANIKCTDKEGKAAWCPLLDLPRLMRLLTKSGMLARFHGPQQVMRSHQRVVKMMMADKARGAGTELSMG